MKKLALVFMFLGLSAAINATSNTKEGEAVPAAKKANAVASKEVKKLAPPIAKMSVSGVSFDKTMKKNNTEFVLKGAGLRSKFIFSVYVAGLYAEKNSPDPLDQKYPRAMRLVLKRNLSIKKMVDALDEGIKRNTTDEAFLSTLAPRKQFRSFFKEGDFKKGSEVLLTYWPKRGLSVELDGKAKGVINHTQFSKSLYDVWVGKNPVNAGLKKKLLGA